MNFPPLTLFMVLSLPCHQVLALSPGKPTELLTDKTLSAWECVTATPADLKAICIPGADGVIAIAGKPVGYLATTAAYDHYQLHFDWRWPANSGKNSNGGALLHIASGPAGETPWPVCFQMQLKIGRAGDMLPMATARFAEKPTSAPGANPPQLGRSGEAGEKPPGEWNQCDITCNGDTIEVKINGILQNRVTGCAPAAGKIGFQLEGAPFELRDVRIAPLDSKTR